jgi:glutamyl-tRNA synthetase
MANLSQDDFINAVNPFLIEIDININDHPKKNLLIESMRSSSNTLKGVSNNLICYFKEIKEYDQKAIDKFIGDSDRILSDLKNKINDLKEWNESALDNILLDYREEHGLSVPKVNQPIRIALTGSTNSPSLGTTLYLFEKEEVLNRLNALKSFLHKEN